jgi:hypothetical protein
MGGTEGAATVAQSATLGNGRKVSRNCDNPIPTNAFGSEIPAIDKDGTPSYLSPISSAVPREGLVRARLAKARKVLQFQNPLVGPPAAAEVLFDGWIVTPNGVPSPGSGA